MYNTLGLLHAACGALALLLGATIFLARKGTAAHIRIGWMYTGSMLFLNASALCIYDLTGGFNLFHILAVASLVTLCVGVAQPIARRRWRHWLWRHYQYMSWSYIGLVAATCNEAFVRVPALQRLTTNTANWLPLAVMSALVLACATLLFTRQRRILARYQDFG